MMQLDPTSAALMMGTIQCAVYAEVHAYTKRLIGRVIELRVMNKM